MADVLHADEAQELLTVTVERVFKAPLRTVFDAWLEPEALKSWWGPEGFETHTVEQDVRAGGRFRYVMRGPEGGDHPIEGIFRKIERPWRLVFEITRHCDGDKSLFDADAMPPTTVTVDFRPVAGGTHVRLTHEGFLDRAAAGAHEGGWSGGLTKLQGALTASSADG